MRRNILFVGPRFYFYPDIIKKSLEKKGYTVDFIEERYYGIRYLVLKFFGKKIFDFFSSRRYVLFLNRHQKVYDILFVIRGESFPVTVLEILKQRNSELYSILYEWDSIKNFDYTGLLPVFDKVLSFDKQDCLKLNLEYQPLFYTEDAVKIRNSAKDLKYDLLLISTFLPERIEYIRIFNSLAERENIRFYYYLYITRFRYYSLMLTRPRFLSAIKVHLKPLDRQSVFDLYSHSNIIIDISNKLQNGLSMRVIEMLGSGKKILTTNQQISQNITIANNRYRCISNLDKIDIDFIKNKNEEMVDLYEDLYLDNWLDTVLARNGQ